MIPAASILPRYVKFYEGCIRYMNTHEKRYCNFMKYVVKKLRLSAVPIFFGSILFGIAVNMFLLPHGVVTGGATGIATAAGKLWGIPVGLGIILINIPIFVIALRQLGLRGVIYSIIGTTLTSLAADALVFLPSATDDTLLASILGGAVMGVGAGLLLSSGLTTGGTDLSAYLIHRAHPSLSTGRMILAFDAAVIVASAILLRNFSGIMYSAVCSVTYSAALDMVQGMSRRARIIFVISDSHEEIAKAVAQRIDRGVTLLTGKGYFTGRDKTVLMCVVGTRQEFPLRRLVLEIDPGAFIVIGEASGVSGEGFEEV